MRSGACAAAMRASVRAGGVRGLHQGPCRCCGWRHEGLRAKGTEAQGVIWCTGFVIWCTHPHSWPMWLQGVSFWACVQKGQVVIWCTGCHMVHPSPFLAHVAARGVLMGLRAKGTGCHMVHRVSYGAQVLSWCTHPHSWPMWLQGVSSWACVQKGQVVTWCTWCHMVHKFCHGAPIPIPGPCGCKGCPYGPACKRDRLSHGAHGVIWCTRPHAFWAHVAARGVLLGLQGGDSILGLLGLQGRTTGQGVSFWACAQATGQGGRERRK